MFFLKILPYLSHFLKLSHIGEYTSVSYQRDFDPLKSLWANPDKLLKFSTLSLNISKSSPSPHIILYVNGPTCSHQEDLRYQLLKNYLYIIHTLTSSEFINFPSYCHQIFLFTYIEACITAGIKKAEAIIGKILLLLPS